MSTVRRGTAAELRVAAYLQERGWLVGSRRHVGGAGDLVAMKPLNERRLVEVKSTKRPFDHFGPADRKALVKLAKEFHCLPLLAWSPSPKKLHLLPPKDWP